MAKKEKPTIPSSIEATIEDLRWQVKGHGAKYLTCQILVLLASILLYVVILITQFKLNFSEYVLTLALIPPACPGRYST